MATFIAARTSGGRSVEVRTTSDEHAVEEGWRHPVSIIRGRGRVREHGWTSYATLRIERDPLGEHAVPADAYYGIQTARARRELPDQRPARAGRPRHRHRPHQESRGAGQRGARTARRARRRRHRHGGRRDPGRRAARSVRRRRLSGRRRHVAQHERQRGARQPRRRAPRRRDAASTALVHPNDHVNMGQSTNDVFPTATRLALLLGHGALVDAARALAASLARKADDVRRRPESRAARICRTPCR